MGGTVTGGAVGTNFGTVALDDWHKMTLEHTIGASTFTVSLDDGAPVTGTSRAVLTTMPQIRMYGANSDQGVLLDAIPEPATLLVLALGGALGLLRRR